MDERTVNLNKLYSEDSEENNIKIKKEAKS